MRANELMVGDLAYSTFYYDDEPCIVLGIEIWEPTSGYGRVYVSNVEEWKDISSLKPIPLTDKILEKNGFKYFHRNYASLSYEHPIQLEMVEWPDENGIGLWKVGGIIPIRYVHEFQHFLRQVECNIGVVI